MIVTRFKYPLEKNLVTKIDLMVERCTTKKAKKDAVLLIEGSEGEGKTGLSVAVGYYVAEKMKREFTSKNLFFNVEKMIEFAQSTKNQIIIWDEPALQALSSDSNKTIVRDLTRLLMMFRKKRHFFMINMTKFYKFNEYIVVDRSIGMIHVYSRDNIEPGRFVYIRMRNLERLYHDWRFKKQRNHFKYAERFIRGTFPDVLNPKYKNNVLSEFDIKDYEKRKDDAIKSIGKKGVSSTSITEEKYIWLKYAIATMKGITQGAKGEHIGVKLNTISKWKKLNRTFPKVIEEFETKKKDSQLTPPIHNSIMVK